MDENAKKTLTSCSGCLVMIIMAPVLIIMTIGGMFVIGPNIQYLIIPVGIIGLVYTPIHMAKCKREEQEGKEVDFTKKFWVPFGVFFGGLALIAIMTENAVLVGLVAIGMIYPYIYIATKYRDKKIAEKKARLEKSNGT